MSTELIPVFAVTIGGSPVNAIDARKLYEFLEIKSEFRHWIKNRINDYGFIQDIDFIAGNFLPGSDRVDYHCSIDMAKELAMVERNEKGKEARQYFIECERRLLESNQPQSFDLATMTSHALRELAAKIEECTALNARIITLQPKADFYDHVAGSEALYDRTDAARLLRTGQKRLWNALKEWRVVGTDGQPYQKYFDAGYFRLLPVLVHKGNYSVPYQQVKVTAKGLTWLKALMDSRVMSTSKALVAGGAQ